MDLGWIAAVSGFALAMTATPGPNNVMVTASGANHGFRRTLPLISGIALGVAVIILVVGAVGTPLASDPQVRTVLKWVGLAYLLWLAWRIGNARPASGGDGHRSGAPLTLAHGALFQLVNPKLWAMVAGAVATYGSAATGRSPAVTALTFAAIFGIAAFASTAAWTWIGIGVGQRVKTERAMRMFNWTMAALLVVSLIPVVVD